MNICEYKVKQSFFKKVDVFKKENDLNIVEVLSLFWMKQTVYYGCKKTCMLSKGMVKKILGNSYSKKIFNISDFERIC